MHRARILVPRLQLTQQLRLGHVLVTRQLGNPLENIELQKQQRPKLTSPDNVILGVLAANINPSDLVAMEGIYPIRPKMPGPFGMDGLAQVLEVGANVKHLKPGDRVWPAGARQGLYQTYIQCKSENTIPVDKRLSLVQAATMFANPTTAYFMLKMANLQKGDTVLQNAANSAVGQCVVQIAREWGLNTVNIVRPRGDMDKVRSMLTDLGATAVISDDDLKNDALIKSLWKKMRRPKAAFDAVGGKQVLRISLMLDTGGMCITYGALSGQAMMVPTQSFIFQDLKFVGFWLVNKRSDTASGRAEWGKALHELTELTVSGKLKPPACDLRPATEWRQAFEIVSGIGKSSNSSKANNVQHKPKQLITFYDPSKPE